MAVEVADSSQGMDQIHLEELSPEPDNLSFREWKQQVLEGTNLHEDRKKQLGDLERHRSTFLDEPGLTDRIDFSIDTGQDKPVATAPRQPPLRWEKQPLRISTRKGFWRTLTAQLLIVCQKVTLAVGWL